MQYDVIVVGGGPAGTTAALYANRSGLKTLIIDKDRFPRDKTCGDAIGGKAVDVLRDLDLLSDVERLPSVRVRGVVFGGTDHTEADINIVSDRRPDVAGYVIPRKDYDEFMLAQCRREGVECREGWEAYDVILENDAVCGIRAREPDSGEQEEFRSPVVLGADGYKSIVSRQLGFFDPDPDHTILAVRSYFKNVSGLSDKIELHYLTSILPGYFWIFPGKDDIANVGIGMLMRPMQTKRISLVRALDEAIRSDHFAHRFRQAVRLTKPAGWQLPVGSKKRPCAGAGFMLLGDAAGLVDPFTGEGIGNAMFSGRVAIEIARTAFEERDFSAASLARYEDRLWRALGDEFKVSSRMQKLGRVQPLLNFTIRAAARNQAVGKTIGAMIIGEQSRKQLTNPLFYLGLLFK